MIRWSLEKEKRRQGNNSFDKVERKKKEDIESIGKRLTSGSRREKWGVYERWAAFWRNENKREFEFSGRSSIEFGEKCKSGRKVRKFFSGPRRSPIGPRCIWTTAKCNDGAVTRNDVPRCNLRINWFRKPVMADVSKRKYRQFLIKMMTERCADFPSVNLFNGKIWKNWNFW